MSRRSPHRERAEQIVAMVMTRAIHERWSARRTRQQLRTSMSRLEISDSIRYAAVRSVTGGGVLDIPDRDQVELVSRGPRKRRQRRKDRHAAR